MRTHELDDIPDVRDGLTRKERIVLYCLDQIQKERKGRNVPTAMLYGRVVEHVGMSEQELQGIFKGCRVTTTIRSKKGAGHEGDSILSAAAGISCTGTRALKTNSSR